MIEPSQDRMNKAIEALITARTWDEKKRLVVVYCDVLLSEAAEQAFVSLLEQKRSDTDTTLLLVAHRDLLTRCREEGIKLSFANSLPPTDLQDRLTESERLAQPRKMPRKIEVYQAVLGPVDHSTEPPQWARLHNLLANNQIKNPLVKRSDNLEQAIPHFELALSVCMREFLPEVWTTLLLTLARTFRMRIRGKQIENVQQAISHYELELKAFTWETLPEKYATMHNNLSNAYKNRIHDECRE